MDHVDDLLRQTNEAQSCAELHGNARTASALASIAVMIAAIGQGKHVPGGAEADVGPALVHAWLTEADGAGSVTMLGSLPTS